MQTKERIGAIDGAGNEIKRGFAISKRSLAVLAVALLAVTFSASAATITYTVVSNDTNTGLSGPNRFGVYAKLNGDCAGLAAFQIQFNPNAYLSVAGISPIGTLHDSTAAIDELTGELVHPDLVVGFKIYRNIVNGLLTASQDFTGYTRAIYGVGVRSDSLASALAPGYDTVTSATQASWVQTEYGVLVARGTMKSTTPATVAAWFVELPSQHSPGNYIRYEGSLDANPISAAFYQVVPEPASLSLLILGGAALLKRRRDWRQQ